MQPATEPQGLHSIRPAPMEVTVDDREVNAGVIERLRAMEGVHVSVRRLYTGDYLVDGRVLFERKTIDDFAVSLIDGRLFRQASRLANSCCRAALILEGIPTVDSVSGVRREAIQGAVITLAMLFDIPLLRSVDPAETARLIRYAGEQARRKAVGKPFRAGYRPKGRRTRQLYILQGLPGVGPERANRLLETFGSVEAVMKADAESLSRVDGVGRTTVEAIRRAVS